MRIHHCRTAASRSSLRCLAVVIQFSCLACTDDFSRFQFDSAPRMQEAGASGQPKNVSSSANNANPSLADTVQESAHDDPQAGKRRDRSEDRDEDAGISTLWPARAWQRSRELLPFGGDVEAQGGPPLEIETVPGPARLLQEPVSSHAASVASGPRRSQRHMRSVCSSSGTN